jgi:hypothetical protein
MVGNAVNHPEKGRCAPRGLQKDSQCTLQQIGPVGAVSTRHLGPAVPGA